MWKGSENAAGTKYPDIYTRIFSGLLAYTGDIRWLTGVHRDNLAAQYRKAQGLYSTARWR